MTKAVRALCAQHHYPAELEAALDAVVESARAAYPGLVSFILSGSTSTGDFVWRKGEDGAEFLSDIDAMIFVERHAADDPGRLAQVVSELEARHASPLFHIDIATNPKSALRNIPASYQMAEIHRSAVVLRGEDVRDAFPDHFDPRASRQAFLANLWKPILYWTPKGGAHDLLYTMVAARFFLDLPLLVSSEAGQCIPGSGVRAARFLESDSTRGFYTEALRDAVRWAVSLRANPHVDRQGLEARVANFSSAVTAALDGAGAPPSDPDPALVRRLTSWLPPRTTRRIASELRSIIRSPRAPHVDFAWLLLRKEATAGAALLGLIDHLGHSFDREPPGGIADRLSEFSRGNRPRGSGIAYLHSAKIQYWDGLCTLYPSMATTEGAVETFLSPDRQA